MSLALLAMNELWTDIVAISGLAVTTIGFVATLLSLYYAIRQLKETKTAAEAASAAARATLDDSRRNYHRYVAAMSIRFLNEAIIHVDNQTWTLAASRLDDLADQMAQLEIVDPDCKELATELRTWSVTVRRLATGGLTRFANPKWATFLVRLRGKMDNHFGPFRDASGVNNVSERPIAPDPRRTP